MSDTKTLCEMLETIEGGIDKLSQQNVALEIKLMQAVGIINDFLNTTVMVEARKMFPKAEFLKKAENFVAEYEKGEHKIHINTTTISDAPLMQKEPMTDKQKRCIDWIEETTGAVYEGGSVSDFINEHIEEEKFKSELEEEANDPNG